MTTPVSTRLCLALVFVLQTCVAFTPTHATFDENQETTQLPDAWIQASEACSDLYYRGSIRSDSIQAAAFSALKSETQKGRPKLNRAQGEIIKVAGEYFQANETSASSIKDNQKNVDAKRLEILKDAAFDPDKIDETIFRSFSSIAESTTRMGLADINAKKSRTALTKVWRQHVLPAVQEYSGKKSPSPLIDLKVGFLRRSVWGSATNVSGKTLHNVTLNVQIVQSNKYRLPERIYFVNTWNAGETIQLSPFTGHVIGTNESDQKAWDTSNVQFSIWCDEGIDQDRQALIRPGHEIRDPFVEELVKKGRQFVHVSDSERLIIKFTRVGAERNGSREIQATVQRVSLKDNKKTTEKLTGSWIENKNASTGFHPETIEFTLTKPTTKSSRGRNSRQFAAPTNALTFRWGAAGYEATWNRKKIFLLPVL